jgi:membrane associated rhomboid family serine protease
MTILDDLKREYKHGNAVNKLLYWNVGAFIVSIIFFYNFKNQQFIYPDWLALSSNPKTTVLYSWTILSYSFLHSGFFHLLFNMLTLVFYSQLFLTFFNSKQFFGLYLLGALFSGISFVVAYVLLQSAGSIVGASGAIMAVLMATTTYQPLMDIRLFNLFNIKLWYLTGALIILNILGIFGQNTGGIIAHLGGAFFGFAYIKLLENGTDLSQIIVRIEDFFTRFTKKKSVAPFKKIHKNQKKIPLTTSKITMADKKQQQIDEILDKISQSGYDSLTSDEREFLFNAGK